MANKPPKKAAKKAAPKKQTTLQKKYNELKAANTSLFDANKILSDKLEEERKKVADHESRGKDCALSMPPPNEFQAAEKIVGIFQSLDQFQSRVALGAVLGSLIERQRAEVRQRNIRVVDNEVNLKYNQAELNAQGKHLDNLVELIHNFAHS